MDLLVNPEEKQGKRIINFLIGKCGLKTMVFYLFGLKFGSDF